MIPWRRYKCENRPAEEIQNFAFRFVVQKFTRNSRNVMDTITSSRRKHGQECGGWRLSRKSVFYPLQGTCRSSKPNTQRSPFFFLIAYVFQALPTLLSRRRRFYAFSFVDTNYRGFCCQWLVGTLRQGPTPFIPPSPVPQARQRRASHHCLWFRSANFIVLPTRFSTFNVSESTSVSLQRFYLFLKRSRGTAE